jgi:septation ring formation regulator EzrA
MAEVEEVSLGTWFYDKFVELKDELDELYHEIRNRRISGALRNLQQIIEKVSDMYEFLKEETDND